MRELHESSPEAERGPFRFSPTEYQNVMQKIVQSSHLRDALVLKMGKDLVEVCPEAGQKDDIIRPQDLRAGEGKEKRSSKDGDDAGGGWKVEIAKRMSQDRRSLRDHDALHSGVTHSQIPLNQKEVFVSLFAFQFPDSSFNFGKTILELAHSLRRYRYQSCRIRHGLSVKRRPISKIRRRPEMIGDTSSHLSVSGPDLRQQQRRLCMESQDVHLAIDAFCNRQYGLIECAAGDEQFFAESGEQLKCQHVSDKIYYVNLY